MISLTATQVTYSWQDKKENSESTQQIEILITFQHFFLFIFISTHSIEMNLMNLYP